MRPIEQKKQLVLDLQQTILLDVIQTYYQILTSEQSVDVFVTSIKTQQVNVDYITKQEKVGLAIPLGLAQAEAQLAQTQVSLNQARADAQNGRAMLAYLINVPVDDLTLIDDFEPPTVEKPLPQWYAEAEAGRQDLQAANAAVVAAGDVEVAFGQYYPSVNLNLNYILYDEFLGGDGGLTGDFFAGFADLYRWIDRGGSAAGVVELPDGGADAGAASSADRSDGGYGVDQQ